MQYSFNTVFLLSCPAALSQEKLETINLFSRKKKTSNNEQHEGLMVWQTIEGFSDF